MTAAAMLGMQRGDGGSKERVRGGGGCGPTGLWTLDLSGFVGLGPLIIHLVSLSSLPLSSLSLSLFSGLLCDSQYSSCYR
jgi:hypothetical protein